MRILFAFVLFAFVFVVHNQHSVAAESRPNIVLILADDLGVGDLGCYNADSKVPTPNYDRLAAQGMRFTDAHTPSSVCTPTRYGLLTGRYCWRTKLKRWVLGGESPYLMLPGRQTIASMLKPYGYQTGCFGKWHLGLGNTAKTDYTQQISPSGRDAGFDEFYVIPASLDMAPYVWVHNDRVVKEPTVEDPGSQRVWLGGNGFWRSGLKADDFNHTDVLPITTEKTVEFINKASNDHPFFVYVPFNAPHTPWVPVDEFRGRSQAGAYGDFVTQVDHCVGEILNALEQKGIAEQTLVIVTSDNGSHWRPEDIEKYDHKANNDWRGMKADIYDAGHRVPFLVKWPGQIEAGTVSDEVICLTDCYATIAGVVGHALKPTEGEDSESLLPVLKQQPLSAPLRTSVIHHSGNGHFALRKGDWKYVELLGSGGFTKPRKEKPQPEGPQGQLYNLKEDPSEQQNLWLKHPDIVKSMQQELDEIRTTSSSRSR